MNTYEIVIVTDEYEKIEFMVQSDFWLKAVSIATENEIVKENENYKMLLKCENGNIIKVNRINGKLEII